MEKLFLIFCLIVHFSFSNGANHDLLPQSLRQPTEAFSGKFGRILTLTLLDGIVRRSPRAPVLTPFPDPAYLSNAWLTLPEGDFIGTFAFCNSVATETSTVTDDLSISIAIPPRVNYNILAPRLHLEGQHDVDLDALGGLILLTSTGDYTLDLTEGILTLELAVSIEIDGDFEITSASTEISFTSLALNTSGTFVNGAELEWEEFNTGIKELFDSLWPTLKPTVDQAVKDTANELLRDCNIYTLIDGDYSCIGGIGKVHKLLEKEMEMLNEGNGSCPVQPTPPPSDGSYFIYSENVTDYGSWPTESDNCPDGSFANGFQVKTESFQTIFADDTAMNGLRLFCGGTSESITSNEGGWGDWGTVYTCDNGGYIKGFQLRSESDGQADNTAANNIRIICSANLSGSIEGDGLGFGSWRGIFSCIDNFAVCGMKTEIHSDQGPLNDDTALNNIALLCCPLL